MNFDLCDQNRRPYAAIFGAACAVATIEAIRRSRWDGRGAAASHPLYKRDAL